MKLDHSRRETKLSRAGWTTRDSSGSLYVEAPDLRAALELIDLLPKVHGEVVPAAADEASCGLVFELDFTNEPVLIRVLSCVEKWLEENGRPVAAVVVNAKREQAADSVAA